MVTGIGQFAVIQSVAPSVGVEVTPINSGDAGEIERAVTTFARSGNSGLIVTASAVALGVAVPPTLLARADEVIE